MAILPLSRGRVTRCRSLSEEMSESAGIHSHQCRTPQSYGPPCHQGGLPAFGRRPFSSQASPSGRLCQRPWQCHRPRKRGANLDSGTRQPTGRWPAPSGKGAARDRSASSLLPAASRVHLERRNVRVCWDRLALLPDFAPPPVGLLSYVGWRRPARPHCRSSGLMKEISPPL